MSPTGSPSTETRQPEDWSSEIIVTFVQVPDERRTAYWSTLHWLAEEIEKEFDMKFDQSQSAQTATEAAAAVHG